MEMYEADLKRAWWIGLLEGIAAVGIGVLFLKAPASSLLALTVVLGAYWLVRGIIGLIDLAVGPRIAFGWRLFASIVSIVAGGFVLASPLASAGLLPVAYVVVLGVDAVVSGGVNIYYGATGAGAGSVALGVFDMLVGVLLLATPLQAALAVPFALGIVLITGGLVLVGVSLWTRGQLHHLSHGASPA
jgi:uncharacterized membrane protein HdeD (DUF308 family)